MPKRLAPKENRLISVERDLSLRGCLNIHAAITVDLCEDAPECPACGYAGAGGLTLSVRRE